jgi:transcription initiation factor TFIIF subunit alpha
MTKIQKNKEPARWLLRKRGEKNIKEADIARFKSELGGDAGDAFGSSMASGSLGPGGRRLRAVNSGGDDGLFGDDDDEEAVRRRRQRELGRHGDLEEVDFDDVFEDDEQTMEVDEKEDEESKEIEVWLILEVYENLES